MSGLFEDQFDVRRSSSDVSSLRAHAIENANRLRSLAFVAQRDGMPMGSLRASNARAAARSILKFAKHLSEAAALSER